MKAVFNQGLRRIGKTMETPSQDVIEATLNLRQVSLEDAAKYGGPVVRAALDIFEPHGYRNYITVDTKVNFLMAGMIPAIPGWHTDGVPRGDSLRPDSRGNPRIAAQIDGTHVSRSFYHLVEVGGHSKTEFLTDRNVELEVVDDDRALYENVSRQVSEKLNVYELSPWSIREGEMVQWDWWELHRAVPASAAGWRALIRFTESDYIKPRTDPSDFIRTQTQVYVPTQFGW